MLPTTVETMTATSSTKKPAFNSDSTSKQVTRPGTRDAMGGIFSTSASSPSHLSPMMNSANWRISRTAARMLTTRTSNAFHALITWAATSPRLCHRLAKGTAHSTISRAWWAITISIEKRQNTNWIHRRSGVRGWRFARGTSDASDTTENGRTEPSSPSARPESPRNLNWKAFTSKPTRTSSSENARAQIGPYTKARPACWPSGRWTLQRRVRPLGPSLPMPNSATS
mmetsp:Transcript_119327/g.320280  ORF Transcript_119327/g.320280 Transcript_119327/m.320280 type:complete len:227 (+) Transcript_119327:580-1260(+)